MIVNDCLEYSRVLLAEPNSGQRWSNAQLIKFIDRAQKLIVRKILWPVSRYEFMSVPTVQEYQEPEILKYLRVFIQGQSLPHADIDTLEGNQIQLYDQTGQGGGPAGLIVPGVAPQLAGGQFVSKWTSQPAATYPVSSPLSYPAPDAQPWFPGRRPVWYDRGGNIGFLPAPAGIYPVVVDCVRQPFTLVNPTDAMVLPDISLDTVCWKTVELACFPGGEDESSDQRNYAMSEYGKSVAELDGWANGMAGQGPEGPKPLTYRSFYTRGNHRNFGGGSD